MIDTRHEDLETKRSYTLIDLIRVREQYYCIQIRTLCIYTVHLQVLPSEVLFNVTS